MALLTTYLSVLELRNKMTQTALEMKRLPKTVLYVYDAFLTQCAYLSRLAYSPPAILIGGLKEAMNDSAAVKNATIQQLEQEPVSDKQFITGMPTGGESCSKGIYIPKCGCSIIQYVNPDSANIVNNLRTLYVIFKGTLTLEELTALLEAEFAKEKAVPITELGAGTVTTAAKGSCYSVLIDTYKPYFDTIMNAVKKYSADVDQIIVTGHSVGGSAATLFGYLIKLMNLAAPVHIVSFGALRPFDNVAATDFNKRLKFGKFTYDNIEGKNDKFANYPQALLFPGAKEPAQIGDVRVQFGTGFKDSEPADSIYYNTPFADPEKYGIMKDVYKKVTVPSQRGGAPPDNAEATAAVRSANTILYECAEAELACHGNYMGISFMDVWPFVDVPEGLGVTLEYVMVDGELYTITEGSMPPARAIVVPLPAQQQQATAIAVPAQPQQPQQQPRQPQQEQQQPLGTAQVVPLPQQQQQGGGRRRVKTRKVRFVRAKNLRALTKALRAAKRT
jgi:hypothetical protein